MNAVASRAGAAKPHSASAGKTTRKPRAVRSAVAAADGITADRRAELIDKAARLFAVRGYAGTSMRDIAATFGILHGSLYHHFGSKEEMFIAVYASGVDHFLADVERAVAPLADPWARLEAACVAHLVALLTRDSPAAAVLADWSSSYSATMREALVRERDRYEKVFEELTNAVALAPGMNRRYFRLGLLGALNGALTWYRPGRDSPAVVARRLFAPFRPSC